ncbi:MAG: HEAT repeat domain-containing protein [Acidobacteria bacterium]|nr:HEAT repeat domain-containing protein [Acidobacteriota bacterium]
MRTKLLVVLVAALALTALLSAGGASAQRQGNDNASGGNKSKRVVGVRSSDSGSGSRVTITADDTLKDYSAYRSGDRFYVVLPKAAAGARGSGSGRGYSDMQVQQRGDSVVLSYRVAPGAKPRVEQKFNRLDVVFDVPGDASAQQSATQQQQPQQQTPPAENRTAQPNEQRQPANNQTAANPASERRQPTPEETARAAQASNPATVNNVPPAAAPTQTQTGTEPAAQNPQQASVEPTQEPSPAATPATEIAQAQPPAQIAPITTSQPATQTGTSLGAYLLQNWWVLVVVGMVVVGLGLVFAGRRAASTPPAPVEGLSEGSTTTTRAKEETARALTDATAAAQASTVSKAEPLSVSDASAADVNPVVAGAVVAKSKKQSKKEARQEAKRKKKGARVEEPARTEVTAVAETDVAAPVAQEPVVEEPAVEEQTVAAQVVEEAAAVEAVAEQDEVAEPVVEETLVHEEPAVETPPVETAAAAEETFVDESALVETPAVEEPAWEEPAEVTQAVATEEVAEVVAEPEPSGQVVAPAVETAEPEPFEVAESPAETAAPAFVASVTPEVETEEVAPVEAETPAPSVEETHAPVAEIEPAYAPEPERILSETQNLLGGGQYDRAVIGSRDAMTRQMVAAELLAALAGRNVQRRERAGAAFVEHGYFEETARDLREADAPAERSAAARSLAILNDRKATPLLVAALEDPVMDVRRAAVEALGALRDPSAVGPLEALLERERNERNRIPPRVIRTAVEFCREDFAQAPAAAEPQPAAPAAETTEPAPTLEPEAAPVVKQRDEAAAVELAPVEETFVETAPEPAAEVAAPETAEETSVSIAPFVEETAAPEPFVAPEPAAEATGEPAHVPEPVHAEEPFELVSETAVEPFVELEQPLVETEPEAAATFEEPAAAVTEEVGIEPAAGEWFDFDISEMGDASQPAAEATPEPAVTEPVFETSSGETLADSVSNEVEEVEEQQPAPAAETQLELVAEPQAEPFAESHVDSHAEPGREIEVAEEAAGPSPFVREPEQVAYEPAAQQPAPEKGLAPFDESSTVPASIQQRIASTDPRERAAAIIELSHVDTDEAFQQICSAFDDRSQDVRSAAARALYELRADRADSFTRALREAAPERRREIGAAIADSGLAGESISQLTGESRERTYEAFSLLFLMAKAGEVQPLLRAIESHPNNEVRLAVVKLLALSGQKEVLPAFRRLAVRGSLPTEVRSAVMEAIYQISSSQPTPA